MALLTKESLDNPSPDRPVLAGSIQINHTSYSGADIKVVVTIYDAGKAAQQYIQEYDTEIEKSASEGYDISKELSKIDSELQTVHIGTPEEINLKKRKASLSKRRDILINAIPAMEERNKSIKKDTPTASTKTLAEVQTISISTHRDKHAVYACGSVYPRGYTRGCRAVAGSLIFTVFNEHVLYEFLEAHASDFDGTAYTSALLDQLPPVDIICAFANEYGQISRMALYGVEFVNEGQVMSIEDILTENTVSFVARDFDPMRAVAKRKLDQNSIMTSAFQPIRASDLLLEEDYKAFADQISPFSRFSNRRNPFV